MTPEQAMQRLISHTMPDEGGFLDMLRPYRGLRQEVLDDVFEALRACASKLGEDQLSLEFVRALWAISQFGREWGLEADGMLRRNRLIDENDQARLRRFLERFDFTVYSLMEGSSWEESFYGIGPLP